MQRQGEGLPQEGAFAAGEPAWLPTEAALRRSRLRRFMAAQGIATLAELRQRAAADIAWFWDAVVRDLDLQFLQPYQQVLDLRDGAQWARWFSGGRYNYVHNALDRRAVGPDAARPAIIWEGEESATRTLTFAELRRETDRCVRALQRLGVGRGDRVGIYLPMTPEVVIATLACGKLGAIFTPIFSGYAAPAVAARLSDCEAKLLIAADGFFRRGKVVAMGDMALEAARLAPCVAHVLLTHRLPAEQRPALRGALSWDELLGQENQPLACVQTDPEEPYMLIYTSGTTGRPKGIVHSQAGFPIKAAQDLAHCFDLQQDDRLLWLTDIGWMMGPWAIQGGLALGATVCLYDGAPDYPHPGRVWELVERHRVSVLGIAPTAARALMAQEETWVRRYDRSSLRAFGSSGEPWNPTPWWWLFRVAGEERCPIINYSGGTEIAGGILSSMTIAPLYPCAFSGPIPGMDADVVDEQGQPLRGEVGELVLRQPWVGMARGFWRDRERYLDTYWSRWPSLWRHGDWALITGDDAWYILGRSDDTIKVAGKRVGPAEVESAAVTHPAVAEAAAIGAPHPLKGETLVILVVLRAEKAPTEALRGEIEAAVTAQLGRALKPEAVRFVDELPRTRNAKVLRRLARAAYLGQDDLGDTSALENATSIEAVRRAQ